MSLQAKLDAFKADFKGGKAPYFAPPQIHPIMERATAELVASGQAKVSVIHRCGFSIGNSRAATFSSFCRIGKRLPFRSIL
jgi:hypothetical protein